MSTRTWKQTFMGSKSGGGYPRTRPRRKQRGWMQTRRQPRGYLNRETLTQELKFFDIVISDDTVSATGAVQTAVNLIPQGIGEEQRIGRKIIVRSISARFQIRLPNLNDQSDIQGGDTLRIIIYIDHQCNEAAAVVLDILETATYDSYRNLSNSKRFTILRDKFVTLNRRVAMSDGTNTSQSPEVLMHWSFYSKLNVPIQYSTTAGTQANITGNNIAYMYISAKGFIGVPEQCTRIRYDG